VHGFCVIIKSFGVFAEVFCIQNRSFIISFFGARSTIRRAYLGYVLSDDTGKQGDGS
jgi:hypothetical protein